MNIAVINLRDLIKCIVVLIILVAIVICGMKIVKGKEEFRVTEAIRKDKRFFFFILLRNGNTDDG